MTTMKKVLVVDDTKNIRMVLTKCLELEGYEVIAVNDGRQALEMFATHTFDLAFIDIKLPEIRGTEVLKRIRASGIRTPVIIITAYATVKNAVDCTNLGAVAYVQKPFSAEKVKSVLKELENSSYSFKQDDINVEDLLNDVRACLKKGDYDNALILSRKALSYELNDPAIYLLISKAYEGLKDDINSSRFYRFYESYR